MRVDGPVSWYQGGWEQFFAEELPEALAERFGIRADPKGVAIHGMSMGGYGALKIAFKNPERFAAVGALAPGILPGYRRAESPEQSAVWRADLLDAAMYGDPIDDERWAAHQPAPLAVANAERIRGSGLEIFLDTGDEDCGNIHDGTEFLHRVLWDPDSRHHYELIRGAAHVGPTLSARMLNIVRFASAAFDGGRSPDRDIELTDDEEQWLATFGVDPEAFTRFDIGPFSERMPAVFTRIVSNMSGKPVPTWDRAYAKLPPTGIE